MPTPHHDILSGYSYYILSDGVAQAGFSDSSGLDEAAAEGHIMLENGAIGNQEFLNWVMERSSVQELQVVRRDDNGKAEKVWILSGAKAARVTAMTFSGGKFPFRVEALEITASSIRPEK